MRPDLVTEPMAAVYVDFCGERHPVEIVHPLVLGRDGQLVIDDDNPYLHRRFLEISIRDGIVWLANVGTRLSATIADESGLMNAWLAPGAQVPVVFARVAVWFTAGPTTYEFDIVQAEPPFTPSTADIPDAGETTIGRIAFTLDQRLLLVALAEDVLRRGNRAAGTVPTSAAAAARLGWTTTKFTRKLDNVCEKLTRVGVRGLVGDGSSIAVSRRARLVEYAVAARLVVPADIELLDDAAART